jgi:hypothetical protein
MPLMRLKYARKYNGLTKKEYERREKKRAKAAKMGMTLKQLTGLQWRRRNRKKIRAKQREIREAHKLLNPNTRRLTDKNRESKNLHLIYKGENFKPAVKVTSYHNETIPKLPIGKGNMRNDYANARR